MPFASVCLSLFLLLLSPLLAAPAAAQAGAPQALAHLHHTAWGAKDGLAGQILAIAQTRDGYLWLGTGSGLMRFDGARFEAFEAIAGERLPSRAVHALQAMPDNSLWVGYIDGGFSQLRDGRILRSERPSEQAGGTVRRFGLARDGTLWAVTGRALLRRDGTSWAEIGEADGYPQQRGVASMDLRVDPADNVWVASNQGVYVKAAGQRRFERIAIDGLDFAPLAVAPDGRVWASDTTRSRGLARLPRPGVAGDPLEDWHPAPRSLFAPMFDRDGQLWYGADGALARERPLPAGGSAVAAVERIDAQVGGLSGNRMLFGLQDREGNVWIGTNAGLDRFRPTKLARLEFPKRPSGISMATGARGDIWFAVRDQALFRLDGSLRALPTGELGAPDTLAGSRDGGAWLGYRTGLRRLTPDGRLERHGPPDVKDWNFSIINLHEDPSGTLWMVANGMGFFRYANGQWERFHRRPGVPQEPPRSLGSDAQGRLWAGYAGGRLLRIDGERLALLTPADGIRVGTVKSVTARGPRVWIGGDNGVQLVSAPGMPLLQAQDRGALEGVTGIVETAAGDLWLNGDAGIAHVEAAQLRRALAEPGYRLRVTRYDTLDGLPGLSEQAWPLRTALQTPDGKLWFALVNGVVTLDPAAIPRNALAPLVHVQRVVGSSPSQGAPGEAGEAGEGRLPAGTIDLHIDYTATSLAVPERVQFRYRLVGQDRDWQDAGTRRRAFYTNLAPGRYRFEVQAANEDGVWSAAPALHAFEIPPTPTQTLWFRIGLALAALVLLALALRYRARKSARRAQERLTVRLQERKRISQDIHDTLLQGFHGLVLRLEAIAAALGKRPPAQSRRELDEVLDLAEQVIAEGRDRIAELRLAPPGARLEDMIEPLGQALARYRDAEFRLGVQGRPRPLQAALHDQIGLIAREALFNAFQHAEARRIEVEVDYGEAAYRVVVRDDGKGLPAEVLAGRAVPGHWGLPGMRERVERIGGLLRLGSDPAGGTSIEVSVPAERAYGPAAAARAAAGPGSAWSRLAGVRR